MVSVRLPHITREPIPINITGGVWFGGCVVLVVVSGLVVVGITMANCGFVVGTILWLFLLVGCRWCC